MFADSVILMMKWNAAKTQFFIFMIEANIIFKEWIVDVFSLGTFDVQTMPCLQFIFAFHFRFIRCWLTLSLFTYKMFS